MWSYRGLLAKFLYIKFENSNHALVLNHDLSILIKAGNKCILIFE